MDLWRSDCRIRIACQDADTNSSNVSRIRAHLGVSYSDRICSFNPWYGCLLYAIDFRFTRPILRIPKGC